MSRLFEWRRRKRRIWANKKTFKVEQETSRRRRRRSVNLSGLKNRICTLHEIVVIARRCKWKQKKLKSINSHPNCIIIISVINGRSRWAKSSDQLQRPSYPWAGVWGRSALHQFGAHWRRSLWCCCVSSHVIIVPMLFVRLRFRWCIGMNRSEKIQTMALIADSSSLDHDWSVHYQNPKMDKIGIRHKHATMCVTLMI